MEKGAAVRFAPFFHGTPCVPCCTLAPVGRLKVEIQHYNVALVRFGIFRSKVIASGKGGLE